MDRDVIKHEGAKDSLLKLTLDCCFSLGMASPSSSNWTVVILSLFLVLLCVLLVYFYKKLNQQANGQYTVRRLVYKEGGVRDQVRGVALVVGTRLGIQLWPSDDSDKSGEEMQEINDEEEGLDRGGSKGSEDKGGDEEREEEQWSDTESKDSGTSADDSGPEAGEDASLMCEPKEAQVMEERAEKEKGEEGKREDSGSSELAIDLKQFSGSVIWSEEQMDDVNDLTQL